MLAVETQRAIGFPGHHDHVVQTVHHGILVGQRQRGGQQFGFRKMFNGEEPNTPSVLLGQPDIAEAPKGPRGIIVSQAVNGVAWRETALAHLRRRPIGIGGAQGQPIQSWPALGEVRAQPIRHRAIPIRGEQFDVGIGKAEDHIPRPECRVRARPRGTAAEQCHALPLRRGQVVGGENQMIDTR